MTSIAPSTITVSQAIKLCNALLSDISFHIEGEVAGYSVSRGTFVFFDLKDEEQDARLSCFMMLNQLTVPIEDGMRIVITGRPNIHTKSGKFSITVQKIEPRGEGSVRRAFELLRKKLTEEGLFAIERKRALPRFPQCVGIISSEDAAGFGDFIRIATSRLKGISFVVAHVAVQGKDAEEEICYAFDHLNSHYQLDCIVLTRGGGSMEDLHAFNSEPVARAIVRSKVPVLVGVGHERDITIADYCADVRASTPSNAAQILLPTTEEVANQVVQLVQQGKSTVQRRITLQREQIINQVVQLQQRLVSVITIARQKVESISKTVIALSPEQTLRRGYSMTWSKEGTLIRSAKDAKRGEMIRTQLADDSFNSIVS